MNEKLLDTLEYLSDFFKYFSTICSFRLAIMYLILGIHYGYTHAFHCSC